MIAKIGISGLNHLLQQADWARNRLAPFVGKCARLATPLGCIDFAITPEGQVQKTPPTDQDSIVPDVCITLPLSAPLLLLHSQEKLMDAAHVTGNAAFANELSFVLRHLRWDVEEDLSKVVGDIAAHRITRSAHTCLQWQKDATQKLGENCAHYFGHEKRLLVCTPELTEFTQDIAALNARLVALEKILVPR